MNEQILIDYLKSIAKTYSSESSLNAKIQGTVNWADTANQLTHPVWKYVLLRRSGGDTAKNAAIAADIAKYKAYIFGTASVVPNQPARTNLARSLTGQTDAVVMTLAKQTNQTTGIGGVLAKLPTIGEVLDGATDGVISVLGKSQAGKDTQKRVASVWLKDNATMIIKAGVPLLAAGFGLFQLLKPKPKKGMRYNKKRR